ncbi:Oligosaccharide translocation protein rft1, partial [Ascosphaera atra]
MESASSPATGTAYLILIQVVSRAFTFLANQILLRYISPSELGASAQLEVFSISVLYFARESIRFALQRQPKHVPNNQETQTDTDKKKKKGDGQPEPKTNPETVHDLQTVVNVAYIPVFLGLLITFVLGHIQARLSRTIALEIAYFPQSLRLTCIACILELLAEPCFAIVQLKGNFRKRAAIESTAAVTRCAAACATAAVGSKHGQHVGVLPFAMGQVVYALTVLAGYLVNMRGVLDGDEIVSLLPRRIIPQGMRGPSYILGRFSKPVVTVAASLYGQNVVKHILTQGDFMTLAAMTTLEDQGLFALA